MVSQTSRRGFALGNTYRHGEERPSNCSCGKPFCSIGHGTPYIHHARGCPAGR